MLTGSILICKNVITKNGRRGGKGRSRENRERSEKSGKIKGKVREIRGNQGKSRGK